MKKVLVSFSFPFHISELLEKAKKISGMSKTQIVIQGTLKECKKIIKEMKCTKA